MRLIDAEKIDFNEVFGGQSDFAKDMREAAQSLINAQPTVEAKPVVHGEWITFDEEANEWYCSKCGHIWQLNDGTPEENCMNFCTKCGADMRGGVNDGAENS